MSIYGGYTGINDLSQVMGAGKPVLPEEANTRIAVVPLSLVQSIDTRSEFRKAFPHPDEFNPIGRPPL
jgi:hypothetical protein